MKKEHLKQIGVVEEDGARWSDVNPHGQPVGTIIYAYLEPNAGEDDGPGEEDGPWANGWEERTGETINAQMWDNPLIPLEERLQIAAGAVNFRDKVILNLRAQLEEAANKLRNLKHDMRIWAGPVMEVNAGKTRLENFNDCLKDEE